MVRNIIRLLKIDDFRIHFWLVLLSILITLVRIGQGLSDSVTSNKLIAIISVWQGLQSCPNPASHATLIRLSIAIVPLIWILHHVHLFV